MRWLKRPKPLSRRDALLNAIVLRIGAFARSEAEVDELLAAVPHLGQRDLVKQRVLDLQRIHQEGLAAAK